MNAAAIGFSRRDLRRIRVGMLGVLLPGVLSVIGLQLRGPIVDPEKFPDLFATVSLSTTHYAAWSLLLPSLVIQCFGWLALYHWLRDTAQERLAFWGTMLSMGGNLLFLPSVGVLAFISAEAAGLYTAGNQAALQIVVQGIQGPFALPFLMGSGLMLLAGVVLFTIVLWKSPKLPRWTAVPYLLHSLCLTIIAPQSYALERVGGLLLLIVSLAISIRVWRDTGAAIPAAAVATNDVARG